MSKEKHLSRYTIIFLFHNNRHVGLSHQLKYSVLPSQQATETVPFLSQGVSGPAYVLSFPITYKENKVLNPSFSMEKRKMEYSIALTFIALW